MTASKTRLLQGFVCILLVATAVISSFMYGQQHSCIRGHDTLQSATNSSIPSIPDRSLPADLGSTADNAQAVVNNDVIQHASNQVFDKDLLQPLVPIQQAKPVLAFATQDQPRPPRALDDDDLQRLRLKHVDQYNELSKAAPVLALSENEFRVPCVNLPKTKCFQKLQKR